ncbi:2337_t:CDS:10 [Diversispora eburnea]|uniref:tRNA (adenine(58)-N(1))-methyltransferase non-catalytic subunit TRM6 n=1 Tax=Diversispora eburnea TaxID=1213867 RepID=A0A9N8V9V5_9GLOM|nr:2337_t:CDS:10 [Diversispora eburnea]
MEIDQSLSEILSVTTEINKDIDKNIKGKKVKGVEEVEEVEEIEEEVDIEVLEEEEEDTCYIHDNQYVLILLPSGKFGVFHTNDIIGKPFGHSYEIHDRDKIKIIRNVAFREVDETDANNKETIDDPSKQKLSYEDIEQLKKDGLEGQKTEYSKAKYIKRKEAKFSRVFTPVRPTLYSVWEYFHTKNPSKIREMRIDSLSQMLTLANVRAYSKMLVIDDTQGLLISGVLERLGGYGVVIGIHDGENHNFDIMRYMNFSKKIYNSLRILSWQQVFKEEIQAPFNYQNESNLSEKELKFYHRKKANYERIESTRELLFKGGFDGLLIASQYQPESILETFIPYLRGSRPIVIYHINKEVLMNTCVHMRISRIYLNPTITESRTHPSMSTSGGVDFEKISSKRAKLNKED